MAFAKCLSLIPGHGCINMKANTSSTSERSFRHFGSNASAELGSKSAECFQWCFRGWFWDLECFSGAFFLFGDSDVFFKFLCLLFFFEFGHVFFFSGSASFYFFESFPSDNDGCKQGDNDQDVADEGDV